jgi:hypothetical protein
VHNAQGQQVANIRILVGGKNNLQLDITNYSTGFYTYSLFFNGRIVDSKKMFITK